MGRTHDLLKGGPVMTVAIALWDVPAGPLMPIALGLWATAAAIGTWGLIPERLSEPPVNP
jgi:hypothetical protein